jgi:hypothetical protein
MTLPRPGPDSFPLFSSANVASRPFLTLADAIVHPLTVPPSAPAKTPSFSATARPSTEVRWINSGLSP